MKKVCLFLLCASILSACSKRDRLFEDESLEGSENQSALEFIKKLGYQDFEIEDLGDEYLVDGDILFAKDINPSLSIFGEGPKTKQYGTSNYVGYIKQPNIRVRIDPSMNAYSAEINGAIAMWNSVPNCRVTFTLTTSNNQDILITNSNLGAGVCGAAYFPVNGLPGRLIRINISVIAANSFAQRQRTIAHEIGHTIGFRHTNWFVPSPVTGSPEPENGMLPENGARFHAMQILGTPTGTDANSLMNSGQCGTGATSLSSYDILAVQFLYPANPPVTGTVPVFRYYRDDSYQLNKNHFFTIDINELGNGNNEYAFEGIGFFAFPNAVSGTVPIYRYGSRVLGSDHYYTVNSGYLSGYENEGVAFYAYPTAINGAVPVYQYYSSALHDHHYTKNPNETSHQWGGTYNYEGIPFYVH